MHFLWYYTSSTLIPRTYRQKSVSMGHHVSLHILYFTTTFDCEKWNPQLDESKLCPGVCNLIWLPGTWNMTVFVVMHVTESCILDIKQATPHGGAHALTREAASPWSDGLHQLLSWEAPQSGHGHSHLQYTMLSGHPVHVRESKIDQRSWIPYHQPAHIVQPHTSMTIVKHSLIPRPPDFILQLWRKLGFSPQLRDKIWEWPGNKAKSNSQT